MTSRPSGVTQRIDVEGGGSYQVGVLEPLWKYFCLKSEADNLLVQLKNTFPDMSFTMTEDGEANARFNFLNSNTPKVYLILGNNAAGTADFEECPGYILTRMVRPEGEDRGWPYRSGDKLIMNLDDRFGEAFFFWSK